MGWVYIVFSNLYPPPPPMLTYVLYCYAINKSPVKKKKQHLRLTVYFSHFLLHFVRCNMLKLKLRWVVNKITRTWVSSEYQCAVASTVWFVNVGPHVSVKFIDPLYRNVSETLDHNAIVIDLTESTLRNVKQCTMTSFCWQQWAANKITKIWWMRPELNE